VATPWPQRRSFAAAIVLVAGGCAGAHRPFDARAPIVWEDDDRRSFGPRPEERRSAAVWEAADGLFFRSPARALALETPLPSVDVNALDEVPDSSWFANRTGRAAMTPEEVARGACDLDPLEDVAPQPWTIVAAKPDGAQPGFILEDATGTRFLLKTDDVVQPERATAADAIVAAMLHAAGYHVPCNRVVFFDPDELVASDGVSPDEIRRVLGAAMRTPDGRARAMLSRFLPGRPLGPWTFEGRWAEDPNDLVPHELRRELRALRYFSGWVDHVDARSHNTLAIWIETGPDRGHVRHTLIDFGDCFGAAGITERRTARYGHAQWMEPGMVVEDIVTFGVLPRAWYRERPEPHPVLGDFTSDPFHPDRWRPNHANGAFADARADDAAWAARIIARFREPHLRALAALGRFRDRGTEDALVRALAARRRVLLERYLTRLSPLAWPSIERGELCLEDLAVSAGIRAERAYAAYTWRQEGAAIALETRSVGDRVCATLPSDRPPYLIVDVVAETHGVDHPGPARVHVATDARGRSRPIGLERPERRAGP
jgi:hypothetical protein